MSESSEESRPIETKTAAELTPEEIQSVVQAAAQGRLPHGIGLQDLAVQFQVEKFEEFVVEHGPIGDEFVYRFWPRETDQRFPEGFAKDLERGFVAELGEEIARTARADYVSHREALAVHLVESYRTPLELEQTKEQTMPRENYTVRLPGQANNPMRSILTHSVFAAIRREMAKTADDGR